MSAVLRFGQIGRCACGDIGRRRVDFSDEPICDSCVTGRRGFLHMGRREFGAMIGRLTPAQRRARISWLTKSAEKEVLLCAIRDEIHACAVSEAVQPE